MDNLLRDLRHSIRLLVRQPGFALTAILTLALGIGATTAIFSVVNAIVLRPLPLGDPDRIVAVTRFMPRTGTRPQNLSAADFYDFRAQNRSFRALAYYSGGESSVTVNGVADYATVQRVTPDFFDALGVKARLGRLMSEKEHVEGSTIAAVVTDAFWQRRLSADPKAIPASPEIYMPNEQHMGPATSMNIVIRSDVSNPMMLVEQMRRLIQARDGNVPVAASTMEGTLERASATPRFRTYLLTVFAVVALLLSAAGIYGVMAYTVSQRTAEIGLRVALGASRGSVLRAVVGQGAVSVGLGLALGVALALAAGRLLQDLLFGVTPSDPLVLTGVVSVMATVALAACIAPSRRALLVEPAMALRSE